MPKKHSLIIAIGSATVLALAGCGSSGGSGSSATPTASPTSSPSESVLGRTSTLKIENATGSTISVNGRGLASGGAPLSIPAVEFPATDSATAQIGLTGPPAKSVNISASYPATGAPKLTINGQPSTAGSTVTVDVYKFTTNAGDAPGHWVIGISKG